MKNKIKLIYLLFSIFNVPAQAAFICPSQITCNYNEGSCDQSEEWLLINGSRPKPFTGSQYFDLFAIRAIKIDFPKDLYGKYRIMCWYSIDPNQAFGIVGISTLANTLIGKNWVINNTFDRSVPLCSSVIDPSNCSGE